MDKLVDLPKILVVDDIAANLTAMKAVLQSLEAVVVGVHSAQEALEQLLVCQEEDYCLLLIDVQMPMINGYELAELVRNNRRTQHIPIIFVSAISKDDFNIFHGYESGAVDFITKPFNPMILRAKVQVFMDINKYQRTSKRLMQEKISADAKNAAKSAFLANMSHEIRTPMNGVIGVVDILKQMGMTPVQLSFLSIIEQSSEALLKIIDDILDYSKIEAGKMTIEFAPTVLHEVLDGVGQLMLIAAKKKSLEFVWSVAPDVPRCVETDAIRLRQILLNLIGNAIKFTTSTGGRVGQVALSVACATLADGVRVLTFTVNDNGVGIPLKVQEKLFDSFTQADETTTRKFGGTGLGLSISKQLVELMGGAIAIVSSEGEGSEFIVTVPLKLALYASVCATPPPSYAPRVVAECAEKRARPASRQSVPLILLAEDHELNREVMQQQLKLLGYSFDVADDGASALEMYRKGNYALLLTDIQMPNMDGFELTAAIRREAGNKTRLPIIAITASASEEEGQYCLEQDMDEFLSKPLSLAQLRSTLSRWLMAYH